jgi:hypothetical protein
MNGIPDVSSNAGMKPTEKVRYLLEILESGKLSLSDFVMEIGLLSEKQRVYGLEALENFTRGQIESDSSYLWSFAVEQLTNSSPAIMRESARLVANLAAYHVNEAGAAIPGLLEMSESKGTVVRWSAAQGLTRIFLSDENGKWELKSTLETIASREEKESIRKIYRRALSDFEKKGAL